MKQIRWIARDNNPTRAALTMEPTRVIIANGEMRVLQAGETLEENMERLGPMGPHA